MHFNKKSMSSSKGLPSSKERLKKVTSAAIVPHQLHRVLLH
jgi:hypothetical protein